MSRCPEVREYLESKQAIGIISRIVYNPVLHSCIRCELYGVSPSIWYRVLAPEIRRLGILQDVNFDPLHYSVNFRVMKRIP